MSEKFIVTYVDNSHGKQETLSKEFPWTLDSDSKPEIVSAHDKAKKAIWEWKKETGVEIKKVERYSSKENITFDDKLGGEF